MTAIPKAALFLSAVLASLTPARAVDRRWNVAAGDWFTNENWSPSGLPGVGDDTIFSNGGTAQIASGSAIIGDLFMGYFGSGSLNITGGSLTTGSFVGFGTGGSGTVNVSGGTWLNGDAVELGAAGGMGTLTISAGLVRAPRLIVGARGGSGFVTLSGGVLEASEVYRNDAPAAGFAFNGGTLRALSNSTNFLSGFGVGDVVLNAGGGTIDTNSFNVTSQSALTGGGALTKIGTGTLSLGSNANSYTGATNVNGGTLAIATGGALTTGGVHVAPEGATATLSVSGALNAGGFLTVGDSLSGTGTGGTGTLTINSGGSVTLDPGAKVTVGWVNAIGTLNLNPGGTLQVGGTDGIQKHASGTANFNLAGGTLKVVNSTLTSSVPMTLASSSNSTIDTNGLSASLSGAISGSGALTKTGTGTLTLSGANTFAGGTTLNGGTLLRSGSGFPDSTPFTIDSGILDLAGADFTMSSLAGTGGTISYGNAFLFVNQSSDTTWAGNLDGGRFIKQGAGKLTLTGTAHALSANVASIQGGTLEINGSFLESMNVSSGGTLTGEADVGSITTSGTGTIAPGSGVGSIDAIGSISLGFSSFTAMQLASASSFDRITTTGAINYGGTLQMSLLGG